MTHPAAGTLPTPAMLIDVEALRARYAAEAPDPADPQQRVAFGTSGHRGSAARRSFNEAHLLAIAQAVCEVRGAEGITGPLFLGADTHALSAPAQRTVIEVFAANGVEVRWSAGDVPTPTPVISRAILRANRGRTSGLADGVVVSPSHNPPEDGGIKYNPPTGGPADTGATRRIEDRANELLRAGNAGVKRMPWERAIAAAHVQAIDFVGPYVADLAAVLDLDAIRAASLAVGADPMGGASVRYWEAIAETYRIPLTVVNPRIDPTFAFVPLDHDGKIRMDCSSPHAMAGLVALRDRFAIACGNDTDADRHGIVTRGAGLMNPNHYLAVAVDYLFSHRPAWPAGAAVGKTVVTSSLVDRVAAARGRRVVEVPVGFKWFVSGLLSGELGFGGEESAGAAFLEKDGRPWTTDKDGILLALLAAEILAVTGRDPGELYQELAARHGAPHYVRLDVPATPAEKAILKKLAPEHVAAADLAGEPITARLTRAPGNREEIGGLKVTAANGWFAARPSGTEDIYKIYAESFLGDDHLARIVDDAKQIVAGALTGA